MADDDEQLEQFLAHTDELAEQAGVELDHEARVWLIRQASATGSFGPESVEAAFAELLDGQDDDVGPVAAEPEPEPDEPEPLSEQQTRFVEARIGRALLKRERAAIEASLASEWPDENINLKRIADMDENERNAFMVERLRDQEPEPDPDRTFDLSNDQDRTDWMVARMRGEEFEFVDEPDEAA